jgi:hypothetical protein
MKTQMSLKNIINESLKKKNSTIGFLFGRFNPPTKGHLENINFMLDWCSRNSADNLIVPTKTQDATNNPLTFVEKKRILASCTDAAIDAWNTGGIFQLLDKFESLGYEHVVLFVGQDRVDEFEALFKKYVSKPKYNFDAVVMSSGKRHNGVSGSKQRQYAVDNDFDSFSDNCPEQLSIVARRKIFNTLRTRLLTPSK